MCTSSKELGQLDKQRMALNRSAAEEQAPWTLYAALLRNAPTLHAAHALFRLLKGRVLSDVDFARSQASTNMSETDFEIFNEVMQVILSDVDFRDPSRDAAVELLAIEGIVDLSTTFQLKTAMLAAVLRNNTYVPTTVCHLAVYMPIGMTEHHCF